MPEQRGARVADGHGHRRRLRNVPQHVSRSGGGQWIFGLLAHTVQRSVARDERVRRIVLPSLAEFGSLCIIIDGSVKDASVYERMALRAGATRVRRCHTSSSLCASKAAFFTEGAHDRAAPVSRTDDDGAGTCPECATDGADDTRWSSRETQRVSHQLQLTLVQAQDVSGLRLNLRGVVGDYPRRLTVDTSSDGVTWQTQWQGMTAGSLYTAIVLDERHPEIRFHSGLSERSTSSCGRRRCPNVREHWSVAEIRILR